MKHVGLLSSKQAVWQWLFCRRYCYSIVHWLTSISFISVVNQYVNKFQGPGCWDTACI